MSMPLSCCRRSVSAVILTFYVASFSLVGTPTALAANTAVTRGDFLRAAIGQLNISLEPAVTLPYTGIATPLVPFAKVAQKYGALAVLSSDGKTVDMQRAITRFEALRVLQQLLGEKPGKPLGRTFVDVKTSTQSEVVAVALEQKWMRAFRGSTFGLAQTLRLADEKSLLRKVVRSQQSVQVLSPSPQTIHVDLQTPTAVPNQKVMETVWDLLNTQYLYKDRIDSKEAGYASVESMVNSLKDPYTVYFRPSSSQQFQTQLQGEVTGIGAQVEQKNGILIIVAPLANSPAMKAGLQPGDEILSVNDESLAGFSYEDAVAKVRGPKGSTAKLHIRRSGLEMDVSVVRDTIRIEDFTVEYKNSVAIVKLQQFGQITDSEFRAKMKEVAAKNPSGIVLDMRNNPGGLLDAAGVVASAFLPDGSPYVLIDMKTSDETDRTSGDPLFAASVPMVVLVNKGSASAAEIVAGALQDAGRAKLVGGQTFGKGTVQQLIEFSDGSSLKMTIAEWHTPKGRQIDGVGITPDFVVEASETGDAQLDRALGLLR